MQDGLAQSNVFDIAEDHLGNLWLATAGGLSMFNGVRFHTYKKQDGLASNMIYCAAVDADGVLWVGSDRGISRYDGRKFQNFPIHSLDQDQYVNQIMVDLGGNLWYATTSGSVVYRINSTDSSVVLDQYIKGRVSGFAETPEAVWITTYKQGIYTYADGKVEQISLPLELQTAIITTVYADSSQRIWLGTDHGLYALVEGSFQFMHSFHVDFQDFGIYSISEGNEGTIWVGSTRGAFTFRDGMCSSVNSSDGLTDNIIYKILRDREGTLWFGSFGGGLYKSLGDLFTHIGKEQGVGYNYISSITKDQQDNYWFGSYGGGIYQVTIPDSEGPLVVTNIDHEQGLSDDFTYGITQDQQGNLWVATANGLNRYDKRKFTSYYKQHGLPSERIYSILSGNDGLLYAGTSNGLVKIEQVPKVKFNHYLHPGGKPHNKIRTLLQQSNGHILLGTYGGLKVFDGETISDYFKADTLRHLPVATVYEDDSGLIWCALIDSGILQWNPKTEEVTVFTESDGLSSNIVYTLVMDQLGYLWVGNPHGLDKIQFSKTGEIEKIRNFGAHEGFFGIETNTNAIYEDSDGAIWFGTVAGAFKCLPTHDGINDLEPITNITGIRLYSEPVDWEQLDIQTSGWFNLPEHFLFSHDKNHLTFEFFGNSLQNPDKVRYQYKLENFDRDWQPVTPKNEAVYTNLPPGGYTFLVKASNNDGVWNHRPASVSFEIAPPFWRTWWFFALTIIVLGIAGRLYYKSRVQTKLMSLIQVEKLKNEEVIKVRRRVAEDFHDQVGNQLASITVLVQLIQAKLTSRNNEVEELLQKLGAFTKTLFTGTRDFIWSIDPKSDKVNEMLIYIRDFGEELFEYSDVNFHVESNNAFDAKVELPIGWSRHIVFIFKEALTNSMKHADCKNVYLSFNVTENTYMFELRDDGIGLNGHQEDDYFQMGIKNMKERAHKIGGEFLISSDNGTGTRITLEGKIPQNEG
ncbi:MAG: hypothetical protein DHS20C17_19110 [Cyclobacteriaceae bacterium]|nr:MAG: hypothetical protein DHS20C17_19110 [Cyclobacteriaceae bacterium]